MDPLFEASLNQAEGLEPSASNIERLGKATSPEASRWAFTQWALRERARAKFERAEIMLFDRDGLEMASHERVAAYHASCFPEGVLVADLGCGIGADLIALARRGEAVGFETDPGRAALARHNLAVHAVDAEVREADALKATGEFEYAFCDPARRAGDRRRLSLGEVSPSPAEVRNRFRGRLLGIKLSPMTGDRDLSELTADTVEFVSFGRECREALAWFGSSPAENPTSAIHLESGERLFPTPLADVIESPSDWLFEADPAAIRAGCLGAFGLAGLGDANGYLTGDEPLESPWLRQYRIKWHGAPSESAVRDALGGGGTPEVKTRGVGADPAELRRKLKGAGAGVVFVYRVGSRVRWAAANPA